MTDLRNAGLLSLEVAERGELLVPVAGLGRRMVAGLADVAVLAGAGLVVLALILAIVPSPSLSGPIAFAVLALVPVVGPLAFEIAWRGQTPGKRLLGLRVLSRDGGPARGGQLFLRNALRLVDFLPFGYFAGLTAMLFSRDGQRLGDLVGGTVVAREDAAGLGDVVDLTTAPPRELHGIPPLLWWAARRLLASRERMDPLALGERERDVAAAVRRYRPDLAGETDEQLWDRLRRGARGPS